jgi:hypothetical protein
MLWLPDANGNDAWCDHDSYAILRDEWPSLPYRTPHRRRVIALVNGVSGAGASAVLDLARRLAGELGVPLFSRDVNNDVGSSALWAFLSDSPAGGVVEGCFGPDEAQSLVEGLRRCGVDPATVPEIRCFPAEAEVTASSPRLGLGPTVAVAVGPEVGPGEVVRIALDVASARVADLRDRRP